MAGPAILRIDIISDADRKGFQQVESDLDRMGDAANTAAAAIGVALAAGAAKAISSASDLAESTNAVSKVFGDASGSVIAFGEDAAAAVGLSQTEFQSLATSTGSLLQNFGYDADAAAESSINLAQRASDMASVFNVDVGTALEAVNAGLRGEAEPLRALGVNLDDATLKARALEMGLYDGTGALDANAKAAAAEAEILAQTAAVAGDFADTSDSAANQQKILKAEFENLSAQLGTALLPAYETLLEYLGSAVDWISENTTVVAALVGGLAAFAAIVATVNAVIKVARALMFAWRAAVIIATYVQWAWNLAMAANPLALLILAIAAVIAIIAALIYKFRGPLMAAIRVVWDWFKKVGNYLKDAFAGAIDWVSQKFQNAIDKIRSMVDWLRDLYNKIRDVINSGLDKIPFIGGGSSASSLSIATPRARSTAAATTAPVVNVTFTGLVTDPEATAQQIQSILARSSVRNGRMLPTSRVW